MPAGKHVCMNNKENPLLHQFPADHEQDYHTLTPANSTELPVINSQGGDRTGSDPLRHGGALLRASNLRSSESAPMKTRNYLEGSPRSPAQEALINMAFSVAAHCDLKANLTQYAPHSEQLQGANTKSCAVVVGSDD